MAKEGAFYHFWKRMAYRYADRPGGSPPVGRGYRQRRSDDLQPRVTFFGSNLACLAVL